MSNQDPVYAEREAQYAEFNIRHHVDGHRFIVDCPGCGSSMILGQGWMGCRLPECPDCNDSADEWAYEPRIDEEQATRLSDGPADVSELVRR